MRSSRQGLARERLAVLLRGTQLQLLFHVLALRFACVTSVPVHNHGRLLYSCDD